MMKAVRLTISLPKDLILFTDKLAEERKISRSEVVASCLREAAKQRALLEEGYRVMAEEHCELAKLTFEAQREIIPEWK